MDIRVPMPAMLRHRVPAEEKPWAHLVSLLLSPPVVWAIWVYLIAQYVSQDRLQAFVFASVFAFLVCALPMLFVAAMVRLGKIGDMHMRHSRERYIPYSIAILACLITEFVFLQFGANPILVIVALVSIVELTLMLIGTFFIHISLHAMAMTSVMSATTIMFGFQKSLYIIPLLLLVILARLVLKRHTPLQIMIGTLIGTLTPLAVIAALPRFV